MVKRKTKTKNKKIKKEKLARKEVKFVNFLFLFFFFVFIVFFVFSFLFFHTTHKTPIFTTILKIINLLLFKQDFNVSTLNTTHQKSAHHTIPPSPPYPDSHIYDFKTKFMYIPKKLAFARCLALWSHAHRVGTKARGEFLKR